MKARIQIFSTIGCAAFIMTIVSCTKTSGRQDQSWIDRLVASQRWGSHTVIEAVEYKGQTAVHVLPEDRPADGGNEHILYDQRGNVICEFGGIVGRVTKGSCEISKINYLKTVFPKKPS
ncbi:DUF6970 domain-containing protein [Novosphingobium barchaimii]|uniref:DUF6970 domain-containing protein n=1 Tax=Novosphingobium barchaimii TaxID=1420591 RepID=UPI0011E0596E|nr:hypothetical protein [Novosphingobium barchaimii]